MAKPSIIIITYNREASLRRLLNSLDRARFPPEGVDLYISIDFAENNACNQVANAYEWTHGSKKLIEHEQHLGLREHVLCCGDLIEQLDAAIMLEDDLYVSPYFYEFATQALTFYANEPAIAGISLYAYEFTETRFLPFRPLDNAFDTYFMQVASSWGQAWTRSQWSAFRSWYALHPHLESNESVPEHLRHWGANSWKKHFNRYLISEDKYFVFPKVSYTTNFEDPGTHAQTRGLYQVPLKLSSEPDFHFNTLADSHDRYDAWFEADPKALNAGDQRLSEFEYSTDLYGSKPLHAIRTAHVLTTRHCRETILELDTSMFPLALNVASGLEGSGIRLALKQHVNEEQAPLSLFFRTRSLLPPPQDHDRMFYILIPAAAEGAAAMEQTLTSVLIQEYKPVTVYILAKKGGVPAFDATRHPDVSVIASDDSSEESRLRDCLLRLRVGYAVCLRPGDRLKAGALQACITVFQAFSDVRWFQSITADKRGFVPFHLRLNHKGARSALEHGKLPYDFMRSFMRVSFLKHKSFREASDTGLVAEWLVTLMKSEQLHLLVRPLIEQHDEQGTPVRPRFHRAKALLPDLLVRSISTTLGAVTRSVLVQAMFNVYFGIPDTIRYDKGHKTYYRERF